MYNQLKTIFNTISYSKFLLLTQTIDRQNLVLAQEFFDNLELQDPKVKSRILEILENFTKYDFLRIPSSLYDDTPHETEQFHIVFEDENHYLDISFSHGFEELDYFYKEKINSKPTITDNYTGGEFPLSNIPQSFIDCLEKFPKLQENNKRYFHTVSFIINVLNEEYKYLLPQDYMNFLANARLDLGDNYSCSFIEAKNLTKEEVLHVINNTTDFTTLRIEDRINEFKLLEKGWFDGKSDGEAFNHDFLNTANYYLGSIIYDYNFNTDLILASKDLFIYPDPDNGLSLEMDINENGISLELMDKGQDYRLKLHSVNFKDHSKVYHKEWKITKDQSLDLVKEISIELAKIIG